MLPASAIPPTPGPDELLERGGTNELLRFTTAGSVDDGKSTLIGRLLHDAKAVYEDQLASLRKGPASRSGGPLDFALLTDGLRAEREQGITIDVAYRYFSTARRKFIIADTPGHEQYTRNMATGASTADLAVILVDASKGVLPQTLRHLTIAALLGVPHVLAAINKMDLVGFREDAFRSLEAEIPPLARRAGCHSARCIPISALLGDNVVEASRRMDWYDGPTLLEHLETVRIETGAESNHLRFPVQLVIRDGADFRGYAGRVASGLLRPGDAVLALPSGRRTRVESIVGFGRDGKQAVPGESVVVTLRDQIDLGRGDILVSPDAPPRLSRQLVASVVWMHEQPLEPARPGRRGRTYLAKHAGRYVKTKVTRLRSAIDFESLLPRPAITLEMNDIGTVELESASPLIFDPYDRNRTTGSFLLIDPISNATVAAGMIRQALAPAATPRDPLPPEPGQESREAAVAQAFLPARGSAGPDENPTARNGPPGRAAGAAPVRVGGRITAEERCRRLGHRAAIFAVAGAPAFAEQLERALFENGFHAVLVRENDLAPELRASVLGLLLEAGAVVVHCGERGSPRAWESVEAARGVLLHEVSAEESGTPQEAQRHALEVAETLRIQNEKTREGRNSK